MAWVSDAKLAAAVSNAGGAGIISCGGRTTEYVREEIRKAQQLTDKPFGVNVMLMAPNKEEIIDVICEEKPAFVTLGAGNPVPYFPKLKEAGIKIIPVIPNVKLAKRVAAAGADAMVAEGMEAGGHIGVLTTMALMEQVLPVIDNIPVVMAGGFADGRGLAAALLMGAGGVQMGTRFLVAKECNIHPNFKAKVLKAGDSSTMVSGRRLGHPVRSLKTPFARKFAELEKDPSVTDEQLSEFGAGALRKAVTEGDDVNGAFMCGQVAGLVKSEQTCKEILEEITAQAEKVLAGAGKYIL